MSRREEEENYETKTRMTMRTGNDHSPG